MCLRAIQLVSFSSRDVADEPVDQQIDVRGDLIGDVTE